MAEKRHRLVIGGGALSILLLLTAPGAVTAQEITLDTVVGNDTLDGVAQGLPWVLVGLLQWSSSFDTMTPAPPAS